MPSGMWLNPGAETMKGDVTEEEMGLCGSVKRHGSLCVASAVIQSWSFMSYVQTRCDWLKVACSLKCSETLWRCFSVQTVCVSDRRGQVEAAHCRCVTDCFVITGEWSRGSNVYRLQHSVREKRRCDFYIAVNGRGLAVCLVMWYEVILLECSSCLDVTLLSVSTENSTVSHYIFNDFFLVFL